MSVMERIKRRAKELLIRNVWDDQRQLRSLLALFEYIETLERRIKSLEGRRN